MFKSGLIYIFLSVAVAAQKPPPSVIGQRNPNAIKSSAPEEPRVGNPGVPVDQKDAKLTDNVTPTASSVPPTTAPEKTDFTPVGQTGSGITLEAAWNQLMQKVQKAQQPQEPEPSPQAQPDSFDLFNAPPSSDLFGLGGNMGAPNQGSGGEGGLFPGGMPPMRGGGLPFPALAMAGGGMGEGGGLGSLGMMGMLGGNLGFGGPSGGLFGGPGGESSGGGLFGGSGPGGRGGGGGFDLMRTYLIMQLLGGGDAPDPPARTPGRPGAPRSRSPLDELMRMERIRMLRNQQMERAMRNRNAPQNQGSRFEASGRPPPGNRRNWGQGMGRGRRGIRPTPSSEQTIPPAESGRMQSRGLMGPGRRPSSNNSLRDSLLAMLEQSLGQSGFSSQSNMGGPSHSRISGGSGADIPPSSPTIASHLKQRQMRVGSRPVPGAGINTADRRADQADLMADYMDNMQSMNPVQRMFMGGGMGARNMGFPGMVGAVPPASGSLGGMGNLGLM